MKYTTTITAILAAAAIDANAAFLTVKVDAQTPNQQIVLDRVFSGNTPLFKVLFYDNGAPYSLTNWTTFFRYSYGKYDTNGMATIVGSNGSNTVTSGDTLTAYYNAATFTGTSFFEPGDYYISIYATNSDGRRRTWATGTMREDYDPAAGTSIAALTSRPVNWNNVVSEGKLQGITISNVVLEAASGITTTETDPVWSANTNQYATLVLATNIALAVRAEAIVPTRSTQPDRWLVLGDSNGTTVYGSPYWQVISNNIPTVRVLNASVSGENASNGMVRLLQNTNYFTSSTRDAVSVMYGINDIVSAGHSAERVATNLIAICRTAETCGVDQVIVIGYYGWSTYYAAQLRSVNELMRRACSTSGWVFADGYAATADYRTGTVADKYIVQPGVNAHLNSTGQIRIAAAVLPGLLLGGPTMDDTFRFAPASVATTALSVALSGVAGAGTAAALNASGDEVAGELFPLLQNGETYGLMAAHQDATKGMWPVSAADVKSFLSITQGDVSGTPATASNSLFAPRSVFFTGRDATNSGSLPLLANTHHALSRSYRGPSYFQVTTNEQMIGATLWAGGIYGGPSNQTVVISAYTNGYTLVSSNTLDFAPVPPLYTRGYYSANAEDPPRMITTNGMTFSPFLRYYMTIFSGTSNCYFNGFEINLRRVP